MPRLRPFNDLRSPKQRKVTLSIFSRQLFLVLKYRSRPKNYEVSKFWPSLAVWPLKGEKIGKRVIFKLVSYLSEVEFEYEWLVLW